MAKKKFIGGSGVKTGMFSTGDLLPQVSGSASIGVNQINGIGGFNTNIKPYAHIHMMSGVWHDQSGQSGVLRYSRAAGGFEASIDGGLTFNLVTASPIDLNDAYVVGNEINQNTRSLPPGTTDLIIGVVPVIIKQITPGAGHSEGVPTLLDGRVNASIIASGYSQTPNLPNTFAYSVIGPGYIQLQASGTQSTAPKSLQFGIGNVGAISEGLAQITSDASLVITGTNGVHIHTEGGIGDIELHGEGVTGNGVGGQISLRPFAESGQLEFRFGPHQAWYSKLTHSNTGGPANDGFWPLPHSGQISQMIAQATPNVDLQQAYDNGNEIDPTRFDTLGYKGVLIRETIPGLIGPTDVNGSASSFKDKFGRYGIAVSGHTLTPLDINRYGFAALNSESLYITSSGTPSSRSRNLFVGFRPGSPTTARISTSGSLSINTTDPFGGETAGSITLDSAAGINGVAQSDGISFLSIGDITFATTSTSDVILTTDDGDVLFNSADTDGRGLGGQIELNAFASSGRLQYRFGPHQAWHAKLTHSSTGGPANDGFWPLPHSGQISQMIAQATPGGSVDLQTAYDNGNEIDHRKDLIGYKGVVVRETIPGLGGFLTNADIASNKPGKYGIAVSGHTLTPTDVNSYGFAALNSLSLIIASSGTASALSRNLFLGYAPTIPGTTFFNTNGSLTFAVGDTANTTGLGGQIAFNAFSSSGRLEYRFGPHQGWAAKLTHDSAGGPASDGFWPLPHSGQMLEQIVRREKSKSITIERPAVNNDLTWFFTNQAITVTEVESVCRGSFDASGQFAIRYSSNRSLPGTELTSTTISCTNRTTGQITTSFAAANIPVDNWVWIAVSGVSGVATSQLGVTMHFN